MSGPSRRRRVRSSEGVVAEQSVVRGFDEVAAISKRVSHSRMQTEEVLRQAGRLASRHPLFLAARMLMRIPRPVVCASRCIVLCRRQDITDIRHVAS